MDAERALLALVEGIGNTDFSFVILLIQALFVVFWIVVVGWVWVDAGERTTSRFARISSVILVGVFNLFGLIIYLLIRPRLTIQELYWADLERRYLKYETSELGDCSRCRHSLQPGFNVCPKCGLDIKKQCTNCQVWVDKSFAYCPFCSTGLQQNVVTEVEPVTNEAMAENVNKTMEEAINTVKNNETKYVDKRGLVSKLRNDFTGFLVNIGDKALGKKKESTSKLTQKVDKRRKKKDKKKRKKK